MDLVCYYDFTCGYSYRAWNWIERQRAAGAAIEVDWQPFVLKEVNRARTDPSLLSGPGIDSVAVQALAIAEALRGGRAAERYRSAMFIAMHGSDERPGEDEIVAVAERAGLDVDAFRKDEETWLRAVRSSHDSAVAELGVFGTPTLVFSGGRAMYLKLAELPEEGDEKLWDALTTITTDFPQVVELKRPQPDRE